MVNDLDGRGKAWLEEVGKATADLKRRREEVEATAGGEGEAVGGGGDGCW